MMSGVCSTRNYWWVWKADFPYVSLCLVHAISWIEGIHLLLLHFHFPLLAETEAWGIHRDQLSHFFLHWNIQASALLPCHFTEWLSNGIESQTGILWTELFYEWISVYGASAYHCSEGSEKVVKHFLTGDCGCNITCRAECQDGKARLLITDLQTHKRSIVPAINRLRFIWLFSFLFKKKSSEFQLQDLEHFNLMPNKILTFGG